MNPAFDHTYAEQHGLVDLYLAERLSEADRTAFEAHYFACSACLEQLEAATELRQGMLQVAAEDSLRRGAGGLLAALARLASLGAMARRHRLALALGALVLLLLVAVPGAWLVARNQRLARQLAAARAAPAAPGVVAGLEARLQAVQQAAAGERRQLAQELAAERRARAAAEQDAQRPLVNLPIAVLAAVRGEEPGREPVTRVARPAAGIPLALTMELATVDYPSYHAALQTAAGRELWQADGLRPDRSDALVVLLPERMLPPGVYRLKLDGVRGAGHRSPVAVYPFEMVAGAVR